MNTQILAPSEEHKTADSQAKNAKGGDPLLTALKNLRRPWWQRVNVAVLAGGMFCTGSVQRLGAASFVWNQQYADVDAPDLVWTEGASWVGATPPSNSATDAVEIPVSSSLLPANKQFVLIDVGTGQRTVGSISITKASSEQDVASVRVAGASASVTINASKIDAAALSEVQFFDSDGSSGRVMAPGSGLALNSGSNSQGRIEIARIGGTGAVTVAGGEVLFSGENTHAGGTDITGGALTIEASAALGTGRVNVSGGALNVRADTSVSSLNVTGGVVNVDGTIVTRSLDLNGGEVAGVASLVVAGPNGATGTINAQSGVLSVDLSADGAARLIKSGTGEVIISGENAYSGGTTIQAGTLRAALSPRSEGLVSHALGSGTLQMAGGVLFLQDHLSVNGIVLNAGSVNASAGKELTVTGTLEARAGSVSAKIVGDAASVLKTGSGSATLSADNTYSGGTRIEGGVLHTESSAALGQAGVVVGGGALNLKHDLSLSSLEVSGGQVRSQTGSETLSVSGEINIQSGTIAANLGDVGDGTSVRKTGTGEATLSGVNAHSGGTTLESGVLNAASESALGRGTVSVLGGDLHLQSNVSATGLILNGGTVTSSSNNYSLKVSGAIDAQAGRITANLGNADGGTSINKNGSGDVSLSGTNAYAGGTNVYDGVLHAESARALGTGVVNVVAADGASGELKLHANVTVGGLTLNGGVVSSDSASHALTVEGEIDARSGTISSNLADSTDGTSLRKSGEGTVVLRGNNAYSGRTSVTGGMVQANSVRALGVGAVEVATDGRLNVGTNVAVGNLVLTGGNVTSDSDAHALAVSGNIRAESGVISVNLSDGSASSRLEKSTDGEVTLSGRNSYSGGTVVSGGILRAASEQALGTGTVEINGNGDATGTLHLQSNVSVNGLVLNGGNLSGDDGMSIAVVGTIQAKAGSMSGNLGDDANHTKLVKSSAGGGGDGSVSLSGNNTYSGGTKVVSGILQAVSRNALGTGLVEVIGGELNLQAPDSGVALVGGLLLDGGAVTGQSTVTVTGTIDARNGRIESVIGNADGDTRLVKTGSGAVTLSGANTYAGGTVVQQGILHANAQRALGEGNVEVSGGVLDVIQDLAVSGLVVSGGSIESATRQGIAVAGRIELKSGNISANVTGGDAASLRKSTNGTAILSGNNTYSGGTDVQQGVLQTDSEHALGQGDVEVSGGVLSLRSDLRVTGLKVTAGQIRSESVAKALTVAGVVDARTGSISANLNAAGLSKSGSGTVSLSGENSFSGGLTVEEGVLAVSAEHALGERVTVNGGALDLQSDALVNSLTLTAGDVTSIPNKALKVSGEVLVKAGNISAKIANQAGSAARVTKVTSGEVSLSGANTYSGGTTISEGVLHAESDSALGTGMVTIGRGDAGAGELNLRSNILVGGLVLEGGNVTSDASEFGLRSGGNIEAHSGVISAKVGDSASPTGLNKTGPGEVTLSGSNTYSGATTISGGILHAASERALGTGIVRVVGEGEAQGTLDLSANLVVSGVVLDGGVVSGSQSLAAAGGIEAKRGNLRGVIVDSAAAETRLTKTTSGEVTVSGENTYSGGTRIESGVLHTNSAHALGTGPVEIGVSGSSVGGELNLQADLSVSGLALQSGEITGEAALKVSGVIEVKSGNVRVELDNGSSISAQLKKTGEGQVALLHNNTYGGGTVVQEGVLSVESTGALGSGPVEIDGGVLSLQRAVAVSGFVLRGGVVNGSGDATLAVAGDIDARKGNINVRLTQATNGTRLIKSGADEVVLSQNNSFAGGTSVREGILKTGANAALGTGAVEVTGGELHLLEDLTLSQNVVLSDGAISAETGKTLLVNAPVEVRSGALSAKLSGSAAVSKTGEGTVVLSGQNVYSGGTAINEGTLRIAHDSALGSGVVTLNGGVLEASSEGEIRTVANQISIAADATLSGGLHGLVINGTGVDLGSENRTLTVQNDVEIRSVISSGNADETLGSLVKSGAGALTLSGQNTYAGGTVVREGVLKVGNASSLGTGGVEVAGGVFNITSESLSLPKLTVSGGQITGNTDTTSLSVSGEILASAGTIGVILADQVASIEGADVHTSLSKIGDGALTLSKANAYQGGTNIHQGVLLVGDDHALGEGAVVLSGGTLAAASQGQVRVVANAVQFTSNSSLEGGTSDLVLSGPVDLGGVREINVAHQVVLAGVVSNGALGKTGGGDLVLANANSYDLGTTVSEGTIVLAHDGALGSGNVVLSGGGLRAQSETEVRVLQNAVTIHSEAVLSGGQHGLEIAAPVSLDGGQNLVRVNDEVLISGVVANSGEDASALVKSGTGLLTLSNANTYSGGSEVREGELKTLNAAALGSGAVVVSGGSLNLGADLSVSGATLSGGMIRSDSGAEVLTVAGTIDAREGIISAVLGDHVDGTRLVKTTNGIVVLSGSNQYSNGTVLEAGTLQIANESALGSGSLALRGGLLKADSTLETRRFSNRITIEGSVLLAGGMNGLNASGPVDLGGGIRRVGVEGDVEFSGGVGDGSDPLMQGGIIKEGNGTLVFSSPNQYSGGTTVKAGTLRALASNALGTGSLFVVDAGVLEVGASQNVKGVKIDGGIIRPSSLGAGAMAAANGAGDLNPIPNSPALHVAGDIVALSGVNNVSLSDGVDAFGVRVPANFIKTGPGTFVTNVPSYYSGSTTLAGGVVGVGATDAFGTGPLVMSGVQLQSVAAQPVLLSNSSVTISGNGNSISTGASELTFANDVSVDPSAELNIAGTFVVNGAFNANGSHIIFDTNTVIRAASGNFNDAKIDVTPATFDALRRRIVNAGGKSSMQVLGWVPTVLPAAPDSTAVLKFSFDASSGSRVDLVLDRSSYADVARDPNAGAFGKALDRLLPTHLNTSDSVGALLEKLDNIISASGLNETLRSVNPGTVYANQFAGAVKQAVAISGAIDSHLDDLASANSAETGVSFGARVEGNVGMLTPNQIAETRWTAWTAGYASHGSQDADTASGFSANSGSDNGGMLGVEREFGGLRVGFVTTTGQGAYSYTDGGARVESDHWAVGTYATVNIGAVTVDASALWGRADQSSERESFGGRVKGAFVSRNSQIGLGVAVNLLPPSSQWQITPSARLKYVDYSQDAFEETGTGLRFGTAEVNESTLLSKLGGKVSRRGSLTRSIDFGVDGAAYWVHDFNTGARGVGLHFAGISNSSFTSLSRKSDADTAQLNLGIQATFLPSVTVRLSGQQDWSATRSQTTGVFSVALNF